MEDRRPDPSIRHPASVVGGLKTRLFEGPTSIGILLEEADSLQSTKGGFCICLISVAMICWYSVLFGTCVTDFHFGISFVSLTGRRGWLMSSRPISP